MRAMFCCLVLIGIAVSPACGEIRVDFVMDRDPDLTPPEPVKVFSEKLLPLWLKALARPEAEMQRMAAQSIAQAHALKLPRVHEAQPALLKIVSAEEAHPAARYAAARAIIVLEAQETASILLETSQRHGAEFRQLVEPVLARWKFEPANHVWQKRLSMPNTNLRDLILAIRCVREAEVDSSVEALLAIAHDPFRPVSVRREAARSAGALRSSGLEENARRFENTASAVIFDRLCAVALLDRHRSKSAEEALSRLAQDVEPSIAAAALASLNANDPSLVVPLAEQVMRNDDANVRQQGVLAFAARPTPERVTVMARLLDDPHTGVRATVRESLFRLTRTPELDSPIRAAAVSVLAGGGWRGQEQAALLLAALDHKPIAGRLVELLESPRGEVMISAAWGLRQLALPETLPAILDKATRQSDVRKKAPPPDALDVQVGLLCEAMGQMKYVPAEGLLRRYIPKDYEMGELSRCAAIWSLGHLHAGVPDEGLAQLLFDRLTDPGTMPPEMDRVRIMSIISMARMKTRTQFEPMRKVLAPTYVPTFRSMAFRWAMKEMTGEEIPLPMPSVQQLNGWFLEPLEELPSETK